MRVLLVEVRNRSQAQKPIECVEAIEIESLVLLGCFHARRILQAVAQTKRPVVMEIVAQVHVGRRGLLGNSFQRRMRIDHGHHGEPAAVGNPQHARASVVVRHVVEQPLYGVVSVGALVDRLRVAFGARRPHHHELTLRFVTPADILKHEDIALLRQLRIDAAQRQSETLRIQARPIGRPGDQEWKPLARVLRGVNLGMQPDAIAHRDHDVGFVKILAQIRTCLRAKHAGQQHGRKDSHRRCPRILAWPPKCNLSVIKLETNGDSWTLTYLPFWLSGKLLKPAI